MLPSRPHPFQGRPCIFQQNNAKPHSAHISNAWLRKKSVRVLDWPACSPDLSPIENVWRILKHEMRQQRPLTVAHLKTCSQVTNALLSQLFLKYVARIEIELGVYYLKKKH